MLSFKWIISTSERYYGEAASTRPACPHRVFENNERQSPIEPLN